MLDKFVKAKSKVVFHKGSLEYTLKVQKVLSESEVAIIDESEKAKSSYILNKGECYILDFYVKDGIYKCSAYIISVYDEDGHRCYTIQVNSPFRKEDRRQYQRCPCRALISYSVLPEAKTKDIIDNGMGEIWKEINGVQWVKHASLEDISGGGLRFTSRQRLEKGTHIACILDLKEYNNKIKDKLDFTLVCEVVHIEKIYDKRNLFDIRLKYIGITEWQRELIIRFVFWLERQRI